MIQWIQGMIKKRQSAKEMAKRLEQYRELARFWERQYELLYLRCAPYGVIGRIEEPQNAKARASAQVDALCKAALSVSHHWDATLEVGYPLSMPFDQWVHDVLLPWQRKLHES